MSFIKELGKQKKIVFVLVVLVKRKHKAMQGESFVYLTAGLAGLLYAHNSSQRQRGYV